VLGVVLCVCRCLSFLTATTVPQFFDPSSPSLLCAMFFCLHKFESLWDRAYMFKTSECRLCRCVKWLWGHVWNHTSLILAGTIARSGRHYVLLLHCLHQLLNQYVQIGFCEHWLLLLVILQEFECGLDIYCVWWIIGRIWLIATWLWVA